MEINTDRVSDEYLLINSCGIEHINIMDANMLREHGRSDYHILYIHQGVCYTEVNSKEVTVPEGGLILFRPFERQKYAFRKKDNTISCYLHFTGTACEKLVSDIFKNNKSVISIGKSHSIKEIFEKMSNEYILKKPYYNGMCTAYLLEFFSAVSRKLLPSKNINSNTPLIDNVLLYMNEFYYINHPVEYYAEYCNLSVSRFAHLFKEIVGLSPTEYIINIRIDKAKSFLINSNLSISEIAMSTGFKNQNYFSRMFKKRTGLYPTAYRNNTDIL